MDIAVTDIAVIPFPPTDETSAAQAYEIMRQGIHADAPDLPSGTLHSYLAGVRNPLPGRRVERALAHLDGRPVGLLQLEFPERDNLGNVNVELFVRPDARRRGVGRALHAHAVARAKASGRVRLIGVTVQNSPAGGVAAGAAFAAALGAEAALAESRSRLDVTALDPDRLDALAADAWRHAGGYRLVRWDRSTPPELLDDVAYLFGRLNSDAPTGDLAWEDENADAAEVRRMDEANEARGRLGYHAGAVHEASGRLVAWTTLMTQPDLDWHAWQSITIVDPEHRGHRLGMLVKAENVRYVRSRRPALRAIDTYNAAANRHMIAINEAMGFRRVDGWTQWQQTV